MVNIFEGLFLGQLMERLAFVNNGGGGGGGGFGKKRPLISKLGEFRVRPRDQEEAKEGDDCPGKHLERVAFVNNRDFVYLPKGFGSRRAL